MEIGTVKLEAHDLKDLASVISFASDDDARPLLCAVFVDVSETSIRFMASDSYRVAWVERTKLETSKYGWTAIIPSAPLKKIVGYIKAEKGLSGDRPIRIDFNEDGCNIEDVAANTTWRIPTELDVEKFPDIAKFVEKTEKWDNINCLGAAFNAGFLADFNKVAPFNDATKYDYDKTARVRMLETLAPFVVTSKDERTRVALMPVRIH